MCTVDAGRAGKGDLEITVNGGSVPCNVHSVGNRRFRASFTPRVAIPHDVEVRFNSQEVAGTFSILSPRIASEFYIHIMLAGGWNTPGLSRLPGHLRTKCQQLRAKTMFSRSEFENTYFTFFSHLKKHEFLCFLNDVKSR